MFNPFRRRTPLRNPTPPWVKWLVIGVVLYAMLANTFQGPNSKVYKAVDKAATELNPEKLVNLAPVLSPEKIAPQVKEILPGKGNPALCGQEVSLAYEVFSEDGKPTGEKADKENSYRFRIGFSDNKPMLEKFTNGLLSGGKRSVTAHDGDKRLRYDVTVLAITPVLPDLDSIPLRIFEHTPGGGKPVVCGSAASVRLTVWNVEGKKLYETKEPILFTPGKSELFIGLEQGTLGMRPGGARTLIVPPVFQKTLLGNKPSLAIPFPKDQAVMVDVETISSP